MKRYILALAAALLAATSCDKAYEGSYPVSDPVENNVSFMMLRNFSSETTVWFIPDKACATSLPTVLSEWQLISVWEVKPNSKVSVTFDSNDGYVTPIETYGVDDKMAFYVFKKSVWDSNDWATLVKNKMWCGCCFLSASEVLEMNRMVTYPIPQI